eukprot:4498057-Pyramimonas_sp.AAC.1
MIGYAHSQQFASTNNHVSNNTNDQHATTDNHKHTTGIRSPRDRYPEIVQLLSAFRRVLPGPLDRHNSMRDHDLSPGEAP